MLLVELIVEVLGISFIVSKDCPLKFPKFERPDGSLSSRPMGTLVETAAVLGSVRDVHWRPDVVDSTSTSINVIFGVMISGLIVVKISSPR